ncbi:MAG: hypothetical protein HWN67_18535, partial [Candidatus Helarchaeota archaeon]|nr:hypothetical protein [Candidatus Helarchaeota archaeon]
MIEVGIDVKNIEVVLIEDAHIYSAIKRTQMIGRMRLNHGVVINIIPLSEKRSFKRSIIYEKTYAAKQILPSINFALFGLYYWFFGRKIIFKSIEYSSEESEKNRTIFHYTD